MRYLNITEIRQKKPGEINPVVVSFQNGLVDVRGLKNAKVKLKRNSRDTATTAEIKTANRHVFIPSNHISTSKRTLLVMRNMNRNKVRLVEVDDELLINSVFPQKDEVMAVPQSKGKEVITLQKMFGGKKAVRKLEQAERLNVDPNFVESELKDAIKDVDTSAALNQSSLIDESLQQLVPPCNRETKILSQVYDLTQLIGEDELAALAQEVQKTIDNTDYVKSCSDFFKDCLAKALGVKDNSLELRIAGILYSELLITYLKVPAKKLTSPSFKLCVFSQLIDNKILNDFSVKTEAGISRPMSMRDKAACYIMVISTICSNYKIDLKLLSQASSYNVKKLGQLAKYCGLSLTGNDQLVLKVPLPALPKPPKSKTKRR